MNSSSNFFQFRRMGSFVPAGAWSVILVPGVLLILLAIAILVWPELLAYIVASVILFAGVSMVGWALTLRRAAKLTRGNVDVQSESVYDGSDMRTTSSRTVIYREL
ncbi:hypothetical protein KFU94_18885 [Chloroflexi bacterium TSY]|nr:hypothetical protein [Chloroflexi bacterium TSY]